NIARVYDGGTTPTGQPFFVMELVKGVPITKYCDDNRLTPTDRLGLFVQVCRAVQHAHQKGIIHRDLKPGNILVTTVDGRPMTKVIDFGVAKAVDQRLTDESFSEEGAIVGTPTYMSPEQTDPGEVDIDTRTDVYALGVVLYELLAGAPPISAKSFRRGAILEMLRMIREQEPEHLSTKASSADALPNIAASRGLEPAQLLSVLRGDVDWITLKALEKDRERRYESANEMAADIQRYLAHEPVLARPPSRWYRLRKFVRRNRGAVAAAAVVAAALLAGAAGVTWQWREAVYQRTQADLARAAAESERDQKEAARAEAEANYRTAMEQRRVALDTVGNLVLTVRADAAGKPDMAGTVQAMVREARQSLDRIARNPDVQVSLNDTTRALLHDLNARAIRGSDPQGALREFGQAADILRAILDKAADGEWKEVVKKNLVVVLLGQGFVALQTGGQADARGYFGRAADQLDQVKDKGAADYQRLLAGVYKSLGAATADANPREAREGFRGALRVAEGLAAREAAAAGR
ncbi:MAG: serine/threonine protein kinase, partial [Gemmataceae bacterium]|nr:serine/threonine protein kinase [Gemmataceae bacterium]